MREFPKLFLHPGREKSLLRYHLWVFTGAVKKVEGDVSDGDWVEIFDSEAGFLASGHYNAGSIMVRIQSFARVMPDGSFWEKKVKYAIDLRRRLGFFDHPELNVFRLINGEGDELSGLIVDYYDGVLVVQCHSTGMYKELDQISMALQKNIPGIKAIYDKSYLTLGTDQGGKKGEFLFGSSDPVVVNEYGNSFEVDFINGQKTGFFIDQRENRKLLGSYSFNKMVLNTFCYTGGFSIHAANSGARKVVSVDTSEKAIRQTNVNFELNKIEKSNYENIDADVFSYLDKANEKFDVIILDPPAFAKHQKAVKNALKGYRKLNEKAFSKIERGGVLFTFSCSQLVNKDDFRKAVFSAAANSGRKVRILHQLSQPADHPINIYHPESEYLKGLVLFVE